MRFVDLKKGLLGKFHEVERHKDPDDWLRSLKNIHAVRAWLTYTPTGNANAPDHQLAAFAGGGGDWQLVLATHKETDFWMSRWDVTKQDASDNRIWGVTYACIGKSDHGLSVPQGDLNVAASRLRSALTATRDFATKHELPSWAEWFQRAIDCSDPSRSITFPEYIDFICLDSYPEIAQRLFATAYNGWVFGGMGSWNDLYFEPELENDHYYELSAELYSAINDAIQQATWSFGADKGAKQLRL